MRCVLVDDTWEQASFCESEADTNANELFIPEMEAVSDPSSMTLYTTLTS